MLTFVMLLAVKTIDIGNIVLGRHAYFSNAISSYAVIAVVSS